MGDASLLEDQQTFLQNCLEQYYLWREIAICKLLKFLNSVMLRLKNKT